jgi:hypothetical protein
MSHDPPPPIEIDHTSPTTIKASTPSADIEPSAHSRPESGSRGRTALSALPQSAPEKPAVTEVNVDHYRLAYGSSFRLWRKWAA